MPASALLQTASILESSRNAFHANRAIVAVGNRIGALARHALAQKFPNILIYDLDILAFLVGKHPSLISRFELLTREAGAFSDIVEPRPIETHPDVDVSSSPKPTVLLPATHSEGKGQKLCDEMNAIQEGHLGFRKFEEKGLEALRYVFDKDLTAWSKQQPTDNRVSICDVVARVASEHDFWNTIVHQFRSRYIVFEFKNYAEKIGQGQIYTTEKYLFRTALRSMAIIISRNGADDNALLAARGALRESGKLIVNLDVKDLCELLKRRDAGDDHNALLVERLDKMLMMLER
jgi:hypothetical protein